MIQSLRLLVSLAVILLITVAIAPAQYIGGPVNMGVSQVSVGSGATLVAVNRTRSSVTVENTTTTALYLGPTNAVSTTTGMLLPGIVGAAVTIPYIGPVYGISSGSAATVTVMDLF